MNEVTRILLFMVSCVLTNNFIFSRFLGICPFLGVSDKVETAAGMGLAVTFVMAPLFCWRVVQFVLLGFGVAGRDGMNILWAGLSMV